MSYEQYITQGTVFIVDKYNNERQYGYDDLGDALAIRGKYAANVFKAEDNEYITSVGFYTTDNNAEYEIYVFNDLGTSKPQNFTKNCSTATKIASGTKAYAGYHNVDIPAVKVEKNHYFSVVVKITNSDFPIAVEGYYSTAVINAGESYFSDDGSSWTDGIDMDIKINGRLYPING